VSQSSLLGGTEHLDFLRGYKEVDIGPAHSHNDGTTTTEALWKGWC
jgi:hypothetical protein